MVKKTMPSFKVLHIDKEIKFYDVIPYLINQYEKKSKKNLQICWKDFVKFISDESMYNWLTKYEYECLIKDINQTSQTRIDWYDQIKANLDLICYEIYKYLRDNMHFSFASDKTINSKNIFNVIHINPKTKSLEYINIVPYLLEYFLDRHNNKHYNFKDFAELEGLVSNALEEKYAEGDDNKILVADLSSKTILETNSFEIALQNIGVLCSVFYATYEHHFKNN